MNKVIFITGATKNTGLAIAEKFAKNGYDVALTSRRANDAEKTAVDLSRKYGTKAFAPGPMFALTISSMAP